MLSTYKLFEQDDEPEYKEGELDKVKLKDDLNDELSDLHRHTKIDKASAKQSIMQAAKSIHGEPDEKVIDSMIQRAMDEHEPKDEEDLVQMVINMMKSD